MKKLLLLPALILFMSTLAFAQSQNRHVIRPYPQFNAPAKTEPAQGPVYIPGKGIFTRSNNLEIKPLRSGVRSMQGHNGGVGNRAPMTPVDITQTANGQHINVLKDERNLPLNSDGKLISPDGLTIDFQIPYNPNDPGICITPSPTFDPEEARVMANCPISVPCDLAANRDANIPLPADPIKFFQLRWTVVQNTSGGATSNIDQARVDQLMAEVNADFLPFRIQFCADPVNFVTDDAMYQLNVGAEDATLKTTYGITPNQLINVYVVGDIINPSAGGYARFPYDPLGGFNIRGGVVLGRGNMFVGTHTLAHELGHTFGLFHTFRGVDEVPACTNCYEGRDLGTGGSSGADTEGDWCSDTNPHPTNANICGDNGTDGCAPFLPWLNSPVNNHMSYSFCTSQFTPQQAGRMHCMIDTYLQNWVNNGGSICGSQPPVADFSGTPTFWQTPCNVTYTDLSVPSATITNWTWNFDVAGIGGVTPATFVGQNPPVVEYTICDTTYTVSLTVTNSNGSDTETKVDYITVLCPAAACDTLDTQWETPPPTPSLLGFGAGDNATGYPAPTLNGPGLFPMGFYERYITPVPGTTEVGAARIALANYFDPDSNSTLQVVMYNSDPTGFPVGAPIAGFAGINPGTDLGVPAGNFFQEYWIPFNKTVVDSPSFLIGLEVFPGNGNDSLVLISSDFAPPQGQAQGLNFVQTNGFGYINYLGFIGADIDLHLVPMLGPYQAEPFITGLFELPGCDTTLVLITDTVFQSECITSMTISSSIAGTLTDTNVFDLDSIFILYTTAPPDTFIWETINDCGRTDSFAFTLTYTFDTTPVPDFIAGFPNPVCAGTNIGFVANPAGMLDYTWDFGDGTVMSSGTSQLTSHTYAAPGLYYVTLTVTDPSGCQGEETKLDFIEIIDCTINAPIAGFDIDPDTVCALDPVTFTDTSQAVPDAATNWLWAFDDGTFSIAQNPTHTYTNPGSYNVTLIAGNAGGNDTVTFEVVVLSLPCILPNEIELHANPVGGSVVLGWETPSDINQPLYGVERSLDGVSFFKIGDVNWDESTSANIYSFIDNSPVMEQDIYYRIHAISQNGESDFSNIATVRLDAETNNWLNVYPNPLSEGQQLNIDAFLLDEGEITIQVFDAIGRRVLLDKREMAAGLGRTTIETGDLSAGTYMVRVNTATQVQVRKVVIE